MVTTIPDSHLRLHPWHRPILRRPGEVQFGLLPDGPIVTGLTDAEVSLLARLDGSRSLLACFREASARGVDTTRWRELIDLLADLGLVESIPEHRPRTGPRTRARSGSEAPRGRVVIDGSGPLAEQLVMLLNRDLPVRAASTRSDALTRSPVPAATSWPTVTADHVTAAPVLVVLVGSPALDPRTGDRWLASGTAHLPVSASGRRTTIGPLVEGPSGPCLWCLDLHRADRDDAWPTVMAQLCPADPTGLAPTTWPATPSGPVRNLDLLAAADLHLTAGSIAAFAQSVLAGQHPPPGISIDICLPWPRMDHRRWEVHPRCLRHDATSPDDGWQTVDGPCVDDTGAVA
ncbi:MAG: hypothetical protein L0H96_17660 [Humibacillus sp.]|nr:hypothetical protein [Humibacillus sp.]MDN5778725.1 hypothetical protein [Humibacillus sp.]